MINKPRGIRNNNPGNIRKSSSSWLGKIQNGSDEDFEQFTEMAYGVRAMAKLIFNTYINKYNAQNLVQIIERYAPSSENNVDAYVHAVSKRAKVNAIDPVSSWGKDVNKVYDVIEAMIYHENGRTIDSSDISKGISMAGVLA